MVKFPEKVQIQLGSSFPCNYTENIKRFRLNEVSGQILQQVEKFVHCGVKVAEDETVMAVHMSLSGKPPKVPVNKDMTGLCFTRLECWIQMPWRQLGWIQTSNHFKLSASQCKATVFGKPGYKMTTVEKTIQW